MKMTLTDWIFLPFTIVVMIISYVGWFIYFRTKYAFLAGYELAKVAM